MIHVLVFLLAIGLTDLRTTCQWRGACPPKALAPDQAKLYQIRQGQRRLLITVPTMAECQRLVPTQPKPGQMFECVEVK
jgi:hypothetical protein